MTTTRFSEVGSLSGVRVLDLSHIWSGPTATRELAGLGAEVLKIENPRNPDWLRGQPTGEVVGRYPDFAHGPDPQNRNAWFNTANLDKESVALDLKDPGDFATFQRLVAVSDIVIANFRPGALERIGIGFPALLEVNPRVVLVEMPGFPSDDPRSASPSFGAQFEAASGSAFVTGGRDTGPILTGFALGDPVAGMFAAAACVSALLERNTTSQGIHVEIPQADAMPPLMGEYLAAAADGIELDAAGNSDRRYAPHDVFRTHDDRWLALATRTDAQWTALATVAGAPSELAVLRGLEARRERLPQINAWLESWAAELDDSDTTAHRLRERGVPAAVVSDGQDLLENGTLRAAGFYRSITHPSTGTHEYMALPVTRHGARLGALRPAPRVGQHTTEVLNRILGEA